MSGWMPRARRVAWCAPVLVACTSANPMQLGGAGASSSAGVANASGGAGQSASSGGGATAAGSPSGGTGAVGTSTTGTGTAAGGALPTGGSRGDEQHSGGNSSSGAQQGQGGARSSTTAAGGIANASGGASSSGGQASSAGTPNGGAGAPMGGTSASGGSSQAGAAANGGASDPFTLSWQDEFETLDTARWQLQNFTWEGNQAQFTPQNAAVANGILTLSLTTAESGAAKPYLGVEMRSAKTLLHGKVSARMRFAKGPGVVSGLVLFYTPYPNCDWNEIDIEHLGNSSTTSQLNAMVFTGTPMANCTTSVSPTQDPQIVNLGFDAEADYHVYDIEWTPSKIRYLVDGAVLREWTRQIELMKRPLTILLTIWASNSASWAGAIGPTSVPARASIDWIRVYDWRG
ncbi:MAG TPA: glycoside hydrolase family 16 protein [Polyangiaceae bacterium]|nr:glycoside hydrolase family 16 protein [Polyangiaceae bacterium]